MAIALMIPVSFQFPPETALILLVSCFAAEYMGDHFLPFRSDPGTSASAASSIEGYEMTRRGKAIQAIRISTFASVGGLCGFVLLILAPPLAQVALLFDSAEYF